MSGIFLSAAEASGDHYAAELAKAMRACGYAGDMWGMGAAQSQQAGIECVWRGERLQVMGLTEVFGVVPYALRLLHETVKAVMARKPDAVVVVDSPDYHLRLVRRLRKAGYAGNVFYVSPPTVWAWRSGRVKYLQKYVTECFPLYKFEHEYFMSHGCASYWSGAPLLEEFERQHRAEIPAEFAGNDKIVAFMPGSRKSEISRLLPVMTQCADVCARHGFEPVFSAAPGLAPDARCELTDYYNSHGLRHFDGEGRELMAAAQCSVSASGTITVESLLLEKFMVSVYKMNALSGWVANRVVKSRWFTMANIIAGEEVYPEFFQQRCTSEAILDSLFAYLEGSEEQRMQIAAKLKSIKGLLGQTGVYKRWAERVLRTGMSADAQG